MQDVQSGWLSFPSLLSYAPLFALMRPALRVDFKEKKSKFNTGIKFEQTALIEMTI
jgi:hypothetical protein